MALVRSFETTAVASTGLTEDVVKTLAFTALSGYSHPINTTAAAITVSSASRISNVVSVIVGAPHNLSVGDKVYWYGTFTDFIGTHIVTAVGSATTFSFGLIGVDVAMFGANNIHASSVTVIPPAVPAYGDKFEVRDVGGDAPETNIRIATIAQKVNGVAQDTFMGRPYGKILFTYSGATLGWTCLDIERSNEYDNYVVEHITTAGPTINVKSGRAYILSNTTVPVNFISPFATDGASFEILDPNNYLRASNSPTVLVSTINHNNSIASTGRILVAGNTRFTYSERRNTWHSEIQPNSIGFKGATLIDAGQAGLVPAPASLDRTKVLGGEGTWVDALLQTRTIYTPTGAPISIDRGYAHLNLLNSSGAAVAEFDIQLPSLTSADIGQRINIEDIGHQYGGGFNVIPAKIYSPVSQTIDGKSNVYLRGPGESHTFTFGVDQQWHQTSEAGLGPLQYNHISDRYMVPGDPIAINSFGNIGNPNHVASITGATTASSTASPVSTRAFNLGSGWRMIATRVFGVGFEFETAFYDPILSFETLSSGIVTGSFGAESEIVAAVGFHSGDRINVIAAVNTNQVASGPAHLFFLEWTIDKTTGMVTAGLLSQPVSTEGFASEPIGVLDHFMIKITERSFVIIFTHQKSSGDTGHRFGHYVYDPNAGGLIGSPGFTGALVLAASPTGNLLTATRISPRKIGIVYVESGVGTFFKMLEIDGGNNIAESVPQQLTTSISNLTLEVGSLCHLGDYKLAFTFLNGVTTRVGVFSIDSTGTLISQSASSIAVGPASSTQAVVLNNGYYKDSAVVVYPLGTGVKYKILTVAGVTPSLSAEQSVSGSTTTSNNYPRYCGFSMGRNYFYLGQEALNSRICRIAPGSASLVLSSIIGVSPKYTEPGAYSHIATVGDAIYLERTDAPGTVLYLQTDLTWSTTVNTNLRLISIGNGQFRVA